MALLKSLSFKRSSASLIFFGKPLYPVDTILFSEFTIMTPIFLDGSFDQLEIVFAKSKNLDFHLIIKTPYLT